jgi:hypothetical protein
VGYRPVSRLDALLEEQCTRYGWCLDPSDRAALVQDPAQDRDAIVESIIQAEFGEAGLRDRERRTWLESLVDDWLFDPQGRGARSGLP